RDPRRSGGPFGTYGVYLFDLAQWMTGKSIRELIAFGDNYATPQIKAHDTVKIMGRHIDNTQCILELFSGINHDYRFIQVEAVGDRGTLITRYDNYTVIGQTKEGARLGSLRSSDMTAGEMEHFLACIKYGEPERCSYKDMVYVVRCIEA